LTGGADCRYADTMATRDLIVEKLTNAFAPASLDVVDESDQHAGHAGHREGGETHFRVYIVAEVFRGKSRLERHRMINQTLVGELAGGVHALTVAEGSAAEQAAAVLPRSVVVGAFHHMSAVLLLDPDIVTIDQDVLVLGDDRSATDLVATLAARIPGIRGIYAGRLRNCGQVEALTANLVSINGRYKAHAGLRITHLTHGYGRL